MLTRTLLTVAAMLAAFSIFIGGLSYGVVAATKAVFPAPDAEGLASPAEASEAGEPLAAKKSSSGPDLRKADNRTPRTAKRSDDPSKLPAKGDPTE